MLSNNRKPKVKALVVDDSAFMRKAISNMLSSDPDIEVIHTAKNGKEGFEKTLELSPDIITMDVEMPIMDGLSAVKEIMRRKPTPIIMISSLTTEGADVTMDALTAGAVDFIPKELSFVSLNIVKIKTELLYKVKNIVARKNFRFAYLLKDTKEEETKKDVSSSKISSIFTKKKTVTKESSLSKIKAYKKIKEEVVKREPKPKTIKIEIAAIGTSTGGPPALQKVIPLIDKNISVPILIVQHMPPIFTKSLAMRLNDMSKIDVKEAEDNETLEPGVIYIAPGGHHMILKRSGSKTSIKITDTPSDTLHKPSVDVMLQSVSAEFRSNVLGVIMTGMGKDGLKGMEEIYLNGGHTIAQNEETCIVYGMPRVVVEAGCADKILPLEKIGEEINSYISRYG